MTDQISRIAREAGDEILRFYGGEVEVDYKSDESPLTQADRASHRHIERQLGALTPAIPVLSEESDAASIAQRRSWSRFWLVDPLDGTKEFIKKTGDFTVNIALVEGGEVVFGLVHVPVRGLTFVGEKGRGAFRQEGSGRPERIQTRRADPERLVVVASRDHAGPEVTELLRLMPVAEVTSMGSSLKFCLVAEGRADFYPRLSPTMEWDTAAAQCIVEAAGGRVTDTGGVPLRYNKESLLNPSLVAFGDPGLNWRQWTKRLARPQTL